MKNLNSKYLIPKSYTSSTVVKLVPTPTPHIFKGTLSSPSECLSLELKSSSKLIDYSWNHVVLKNRLFPTARRMVISMNVENAENQRLPVRQSRRTNFFLTFQNLRETVLICLQITRTHHSISLNTLNCSCHSQKAQGMIPSPLRYIGIGAARHRKDQKGLFREQKNGRAIHQMWRRKMVRRL